MARNEGARGFHAAVQIDARRERLEQAGNALSSRRARREEVLFQAHGADGFFERLCRHEADARGGHLPLPAAAAVQLFRDQKAEHRVAQKFQPLVALPSAAVGIRGMGEAGGKERFIAERIADFALDL